jgi:hypothetical protein
VERRAKLYTIALEREKNCIIVINIFYKGYRYNTVHGGKNNP